ncbi:MAG: inner membrane CreD family protein [Bacteroidota bacterium]
MAALVTVFLLVLSGIAAGAFFAGRFLWRLASPAFASHLTLSPMIKRLFAVAFIFGCCSVAWAFLGGTVVHRTQTSGASYGSAVGELWGGPQTQRAPTVARLGERTRNVTRQEADGEGGVRSVVETVTETTRASVPVAGSDLKADLSLDHRKKGLMWYPTYTAAFDGTYRIANDTEEDGRYEVVFPLPDGSAVFSDLALDVDGETVTVNADGGRIVHVVEIAAGAEADVRVRYGSQGVSTWRYAFGSGSAHADVMVDEYGERTVHRGGVHTARDVRLVATTDFGDIDFPEGTLSPTDKERADGGWTLTWDHGTLVSSAGFGVEMPQKLNPGPWVSRVTFFAPVSLFLFFFAVFVLSLLRGVRLHPMHYFFLGAACFAFHLLLAYLVDHVSIATAMAVASVVSVALVVSYVRLVAGLRFALFEVGGAQMVYLVAFAATFFLEGFTGLAVTLLSVATLFVVMQATGRLDWEAVLARPESAALGGSARRDQPAVAGA